MSDAMPRSPASRRTFIRQGAAAAVALPTVAAALAACGETKATVPPPKDPKPAAPPPAVAPPAVPPAAPPAAPVETQRAAAHTCSG